MLFCHSKLQTWKLGCSKKVRSRAFLRWNVLKWQPSTFSAFGTLFMLQASFTVEPCIVALFVSPKTLYLIKNKQVSSWWYLVPVGLFCDKMPWLFMGMFKLFDKSQLNKMVLFFKLNDKYSRLVLKLYIVVSNLFEVVGIHSILSKSAMQYDRKSNHCHWRQLRHRVWSLQISRRRW